MIPSHTLISSAPPVVEDSAHLGTLAERALHGAVPYELAEQDGLGADARELFRILSGLADDAALPWPARMAGLESLADRRGMRRITGEGCRLDRVLAPHGPVRLLQPPGDTGIEAGVAGIRLLVGPGERSRLWVQFDEGAAPWMHVVMLPTLHQESEPVVALRYLQGNEAEEVAVRLRRNGLVLHKEVEHPIQPAVPFFLSIGVITGEMRILVNGVPAYCRAARHAAPTGYILDVIGIPSGSTDILLPFIAFEAAGADPFGIEPDAEARLVGALLTHAAAKPKGLLRRSFHALADAPCRIAPQAVRAMIAANRDGTDVFDDGMETLLLQRLPDAERARINGRPPDPIARIRDVTIALSTNPGGNGMQKIFSRKPKIRRTLVDHVSFDAYSGDIIGIIGRNGAGKTTFLKSLVGAMPLAAGRIDIESRPILLRPGAGMQPELTGRQNIYKTGLYMDMTMQEIQAMMDDVISFAELEDHIDRPFRYYSDGMRARLIFSMATALPRDILLLDELLSAGDMGFQQRAMERLHSFLSRARLVFVVQHTFDFVLTRCTKCLLLENGTPVYFGDPSIATELYRELL